VTPSTLRARAAAFFIEPREPAVPPGDLADLVPLVRREPPPGPPRPDRLSDPVGYGPPRPDRLSDPVGYGPPRRERPAEPVAFGRPRLKPPAEPVGFGPPALAPPSPPIGSVPRAAVLGRAVDAVPAAAALACALRAAHGSSAAVVATWLPGDARGPAPRGPGAPGAARVAARLAARGLAATAHGRLAWLPLSDHVVAASVAARRASAALDVPLVVALAGPRCDIVEGLLSEQDLVVVVTVDPEAPLARLAVSGCTRPAEARKPPRGVRRMLALAGLAAGTAWR
jgi:hypothetical protein